MSIYSNKPTKFFEHLADEAGNARARVYCAGFESGKWRSKQLAFHLAEWLPEYALTDIELQIDHGNVLVKLNQAAVRVYTSPKYEKRGEAGEIALHALCREYFGTIPISPRVFYKSASNDVVKAFDLVHVRFPNDDSLEIWLGESKLFHSGVSAIRDAIRSVRSHVEAGFLSNEKLLIGPQIPKSTPRYEELMSLFRRQESLDSLIKKAVFPIGIFCDSDAAKSAKDRDPSYIEAVVKELQTLNDLLQKEDVSSQITIYLFYIPLGSKADLVADFDARLKGLQ